MEAPAPNSTSSLPPAGCPESRPTTLWRHADFMRLWVGQTISLLGSSFTRMALPLIAATVLNATPAEAGLLEAIGTLPALLIGLFVGVWVDRYRRRTFLIGGDVGRALVLVTIPLAAMLGVLSMYQLYAVAFLAGTLSVFFYVAYNSYLPSLVDRGQLTEGNSKLELSGSLTAVIGPAIAGKVIRAVTAPLAVGLDALSFLVSALFLVRIERREEPPQSIAAPMIGQLREGLATVFGNPSLRALAGCLATSNLASNVFFALYMIFGTRDLGLKADQLGLVYGIGASGAVLSALVSPWIAAHLGVGRAIIYGALLGSLEVLPAVLATPRSAIPLLMLSSLLGNFGWVLYSTNQVSLRQAITPAALLGRTNATLRFIVNGALPIGALIGGALGQTLGVRQAIAISAAASALASLWLLFSPIRGLGKMPTYETEG